ncbi:hypothetical protein TDB9533_02357 [Thalassocella blandensis]|nr:hypothetical protein TDB9533_02357 [Thalassocella blandensis]
MSTHWPTFDELLALADNAPDKLEELRRREITRIIDSAPEHLRKRLHGLQFQINCQIELHSTPLGACVAISRMMHDSLAKLNDALNGSYQHAPAAPHSDNVVPFHCAGSMA